MTDHGTTDTPYLPPIHPHSQPSNRPAIRLPSFPVSPYRSASVTTNNRTLLRYLAKALPRSRDTCNAEDSGAYIYMYMCVCTETRARERGKCDSCRGGETTGRGAHVVVAERRTTKRNVCENQRRRADLATKSRQFTRRTYARPRGATFTAGRINY